VTTPPPAPATREDDSVGAFLYDVGTGQTDTVRAALAATPALANAIGPHPFWGGRPQALHVAVESNRPEIVLLLIEHGADVNGINHEYGDWSPLLIAAHARRDRLSQALIERGARVGLTEALALGDDARLDAILDADSGAAARAPVPGGATPLHFARTLHAVDRLLALGVAADRRNVWGVTAAAEMSRLGDAGAPLVARLVERGAAVGPAELVRVGDRAALERMLAVNAAAVRAPAALLAAAGSGRHEIARWLIAAGSDVNARGLRGETPLHVAAWAGDLEMARLLVEAGADLGARDPGHGTTPLRWAETASHIAARDGPAAVADYLRALHAE
jgi:ankyrin repeat protein